MKAAQGKVLTHGTLPQDFGFTEQTNCQNIQGKTVFKQQNCDIRNITFEQNKKLKPTVSFGTNYQSSQLPQVSFILSTSELKCFGLCSTLQQNL